MSADDQAGITGPAPRVTRSEDWSAALLKACVVLVLSFALLVYLPNRLLAFLTTRVGPNVRDGIVTGWDTVFFVLLAWGFVILQRQGRK